MSTALEKAKADNVKLKQSIAAKNSKAKIEGKAILREAVGQLGSTLGAVGCAALDAKYASAPGDMAHFGESTIPVAPVIGGVIALASLALVKVSPVAAAGVGRFGAFGVDLGIYHGARDKFAEMMG